MPDPDSDAELLDDRITPLTRAGSGAGPGAGPLTVRGLPVWLLILVSVLVALVVAVGRLGTPDPRLAAVATPGLPGLFATQPVPSPVLAETLEPSPSVDGGPCGTESIQFQTNVEPLPPLDLPTTRLPMGGLMAFVVEDNSTSGSIALANARGDEGGTTAAGVIATFTGSDIEPGRSVAPIALSTSGYALLVSAGHEGQSLGDGGCNGLYLFRYEDSRVILTSLTHADGPGARAEGASLSSDGRRVAYIQGNDVRLGELIGPRPSAAFNSCDHPRGRPVRWSPDESQLLAICDRDLVVVDLVTGEDRIFAAQPNTILMTAGWAADGSIVTVAARTGAIQAVPLVVSEIDPETGDRTERFETDVSTQWVVGTSTISPNARWALVQGDASYTTFAVNTETGVTTQLPWPVLPVSFGPVTIAWLADSNSFLSADAGILYRVDLAAMTRTEVGAIPSSQFAWHESPP